MNVRQALILFLTLIFYDLPSGSAFAQDSTSAETIAIKVTAVPRADMPKPKVDKARRAHKKPAKPPVGKPASTQRSTQDPDKTPVSRDSNRLNTYQKDTFNRKFELNNQTQHKQPRKFSSKNIYFLTGLLMLIAGIIITLFFRTGVSLMIGIILIIAGYYILLYSLLFLE